MKLLYLPAYTYPEKAASEYLGHNMNQAFADAGFQMIVYAPIPTRGVSREVRERYKKIKCEERFNGYMKVHRFAMYREGKNIISRALRYVFCAVKQFYIGVFAKDVQDCEILFIASTPPIQGAMAALVKKFRKISFVYNLQDIFPDSLVGTGMTHRGSFLWKIGRIIENFTYRNADKIIVISEDFKKNIMAKGVPEEKIEVIYNWVDEQAVLPVPREQNKLFDRYGLDRSAFYVTYCGNIGLTQNMDMLLQVAKELEVYPDIKFVLIGEGAYKKQVEKVVAEWDLTNELLLPFQPYEDIAHVFSLGNVGLVISKPGVGENSVPSKTWSILSAARPVLASFDENELKTIIDRNECGVFTRAGDKDSFIQALMKFYHDRDYCHVCGKRGREFILNNLTREVGTSKYVTVLREVVETTKK